MDIRLIANEIDDQMNIYSWKMKYLEMYLLQVDLL